MLVTAEQSSKEEKWEYNQCSLASDWPYNRTSSPVALALGFSVPNDLNSYVELESEVARYLNVGSICHMRCLAQRNQFYSFVLLWKGKAALGVP